MNQREIIFRYAVTIDVFSLSGTFRNTLHCCSKLYMVGFYNRFINFFNVSS